MNINIKKRGKIVQGLDAKLTDLLEFLKQNESTNKYGTEEIGTYDYSVLKGEIEDLLEQIKDA